MQIRWTSFQGKQTRTNNDAAAAGIRGDYFLAMLVDAADEGSNGQALARHWAKTIIEDVISSDEPPGVAALIARMREQQLRLRHDYLHAIASYCCMLLDRQSHELHFLYTGDCLAGVQQADGAIDWFFSPHTLNSQPDWPEANTGNLASLHPQVLTRSLNARRFVTPCCHTSSYEPGDTIVLCTDGYWSEHLQRAGNLLQLDDDASALFITAGDTLSSRQEGPSTDNFFYLRRE